MDGGATQREIVMRVSAKADPSLTAPMQEMARSARDAARGELEYQRALERRGRVLSSLADSQKKAAAGYGEAMAAEDRLQKKIRERGKLLNETAIQQARRTSSMGAGSFGKGVEQFGDDLAGASPLARYLSPATAALGAFTLAVKTAQVATESYYHSLQYNPATGRAEANPVTSQQSFRKGLSENWFTSFFGLFTQRMKRQGGDTSREAYEKYASAFDSRGSVRRWLDEHLGNTAPGVYTPKMSYEQFVVANTSERQRERRAFEAEQRLHYAPMIAGAEARERSQRQALAKEQARLMGDVRSQVALSRAGQRLTQEAGARRMAAIGLVGARPAYEREAEIEDIHRQIERQRALAENTATGQARQMSIAHQMHTATAQEQSLRAMHRAASAKEQLAKEREAGAQGLGVAEQTNRAKEAQAASAERRQIEEELLGKQREVLELRRAGEESIKDTMLKESEILRSSLETVQRQRESLKRASMGEREDLALMNPFALRSLHRVSEKVRQGQRLTEREKDLALSHRGVLGKQVQEIAQDRLKRGNTAGMIADIQRNSGRVAREQALGAQEVKLKQEIAIQVNVAQQGLVQEIAKTLAPQIRGMMATLRIQLDNELARIRHEQQTQRRTMFPEQP